jgi:hypothetical protein
MLTALQQKSPVLSAQGTATGGTIPFIAWRQKSASEL